MRVFFIRVVIRPVVNEIAARQQDREDLQEYQPVLDFPPEAPRLIGEQVIPHHLVAGFGKGERQATVASFQLELLLVSGLASGQVLGGVVQHVLRESPRPMRRVDVHAVVRVALEEFNRAVELVGVLRRVLGSDGEQRLFVEGIGALTGLGRVPGGGSFRPLASVGWDGSLSVARAFGAPLGQYRAAELRGFIRCGGGGADEGDGRHQNKLFLKIHCCSSWLARRELLVPRFWWRIMA